jgi:hypothetical protein
MPTNPNSKNIKIVESITNTEKELNPFYDNLREENIKEGYLLCYHYRIVSIQNCLNKIKYNNFYKKYKLKDLLLSDCAELKDETLKNKSNIIAT